MVPKIKYDEDRRRDEPLPRIELDRGGSGPGGSTARLLDPEVAQERMAHRASNVRYDAGIELEQGTNRRAKDRDRATARSGATMPGPRQPPNELGDPDMQRTPVSRYRKRVLIKERVAAQKAATAGELRALTELVAREDPTSSQAWKRINDALSDASGDAYGLTTRDRRRVKAIDRFIRKSEQANRSTHTVYFAVTLPESGVPADVEMRSLLQSGDGAAFDRYTIGYHQAHEALASIDESVRHRTVLVELRTRRGAYLGQGPAKDATQRLLPRGMMGEVISSGESTTVVGADKGRRRIPILQLQDATPEAHEVAEQVWKKRAARLGIKNPPPLP